MKIGDVEMEADDPSVYLREMLAEHVSPRSDDLPPFTGGLVGYFSYDYPGYAEPSVRCDVEDTEDFKDVDLMLFDKVIAFDNLRQVIVLIADMQLAEGETGYNKAALELKHMAELLREGKKIREPAGRLKGPVTPLFDRKRYCDMVERAKAHIREGDIFQIVLSNRLSAPFEGSLLNAYRVLRTINPSPYMFYLSGTDVEVAGVEREYFLAGGLDARNVRAAIRRLSPYAVDVSSGIESDGIKDEKKMAAFVAAVRQENDIT